MPLANERELYIYSGITHHVRRKMAAGMVETSELYATGDEERSKKHSACAHPIAAEPMHT